jgi:alkylation response protein AidB-like acyl-CoA dehydrogenase
MKGKVSQPWNFRAAQVQVDVLPAGLPDQPAAQHQHDQVHARTGPMRDARIQRIHEGSSEIQRITIGRMLVG